MLPVMHSPPYMALAKHILSWHSPGTSQSIYTHSSRKSPPLHALTCHPAYLLQCRLVATLVHLDLPKKIWMCIRSSKPHVGYLASALFSNACIRPPLLLEGRN